MTPKMPVMSFSSVPRIDRDQWTLSVTGLVPQRLQLGWAQFIALGDAAQLADFHCVTQWTRLDVAWQGVPATRLLDLAMPAGSARYVTVHCADGYATNLETDVLRDPAVLFAHAQDGSPLAPEHGYPARLVVPSRYGWKSAKWVTAIEFTEENRPGLWETNGYHMRGDPWREERFGKLR